MLGWNSEAYSLFPFKTEMVAAVYWFSLAFLQCSPLCLYWMARVPLPWTHWEPGKRDGFFSYIFKFLSVRIVTKAYFPSAFYHCHLKNVLWLPQCDLPCLFSVFLPFFPGTQKCFCATEPMSTSSRLSLIHGGNWTTGLMHCPGLHTVWFLTGIMVIKQLNICVFSHVIWGYILQFLWWQRQMPPFKLQVMSTILPMELFVDPSSLWALRHNW